MSNTGSGGGYGGEGFTDYEDQVNWDTVGSPVPQGDYDGEVIKAEYKPTSAGKHMAKVQLKIEAAYDQANEEKGKDRLVFENFVFTQEAGFRVKNFAEMAGIELPTILNKEIVEQWAASIVGIKIGFNVKHREWQGSKQASVTKFFPYQAGAAGDQQAEEQQAEEQQAEEQAPAPPPAAKPQSTLRQAAAAPKANGTTNGAAHKPTTKPAAKPATKPAAKR